MNNNSLKYKCIGSVVQIPCEIIDPNPYCHNFNFSSEELNKLTLSVIENGIILPLSVKKCDNGRFRIISGERRLRAAILANMIYVPCIIVNITDNKIDELLLIEKLQNKNINIIQEAQMLYNYTIKYNISPQQLSSVLNINDNYVLNRILLLNSRNNFLDKIRNNNIPDEIIEYLILVKSEAVKNRILDYYIKNLNYLNETVSYVSSKSHPYFNKKLFKLNNLKLFINSFNQTVDAMQKAGIKAVSEQYEYEEYSEYVVRIPKTATSPVVLSECVSSA